MMRSVLRHEPLRRIDRHWYRGYVEHVARGHAPDFVSAWYLQSELASHAGRGFGPALGAQAGHRLSGDFPQPEPEEGSALSRLVETQVGWPSWTARRR